MGRPTRALVLTDYERRILRRWQRQPATDPALALRARIVLACAEGLSNLEVAARLGIHRTTVGTWRSRFLEWRLEGLGNRPQPGAPRTITDVQVRQVIITTLEQSDRAWWSARSLAELVGVSPSTVGRIWRAFGLDPRLVEPWKRATDPRRIEEVHDVVGFYLNPPEAVMVLCAEQPTPAVRPGGPGPPTRDHQRDGAGNLEAALDVAVGLVLPEMTPWRRVLEFQSLLRLVDQAVPAALGIHLILEISPTYTAPAIRRWLRGHPRVRLRFAPSYTSWRALVVGWLDQLAARHGGAYRASLAAEPARLLWSWIDAWDQASRPFVWTR